MLTPYIIRNQENIRVIFERKMQERQEIVNRYFVFGDSPWKPPQDFRRSNGLVEDIRQSLLAQEEKRRFDEESRPAEAAAQAGPPITRPLGSGHASREQEPDAPKAGAPAAPAGTGTRPAQGGSARPSRRVVDRVECGRLGVLNSAPQLYVPAGEPRAPSTVAR